ncbi:MAG: hypothetical protein ACFCUL_06030 [Flavobacteriaceae bacterium]
MAEEVIDAKTGLKGCLFTTGIAFLLFVLAAIAYLIYVFYLDDSIPSN